MYTLSPEAATAIAQLMHTHAGHRVAPEGLSIIAAGASGRTLVRSAELPGLIGVYWTAARADNNSFLPAAWGLKQAGVHVPDIVAQECLGNGTGVCLVQDLGETDLLSLKNEPWSTKQMAYKQALEAVHALHCTHPNWELQPGFDAGLYRWEQEYFAQHYLHAYCGKDTATFLADAAMTELADTTAALPTCPIHRDFQSQNIMLHADKAWLIDFQGMREGRAEYDLASLLLDPYMGLTPHEQDELLHYYESLSGKSIDRSIYAACAIQRIMQALGAYANIGLNQHKDWYINLIPAGLHALRRAMSLAPAGSPAARAAACLQAVL